MELLLLGFTILGCWSFFAFMDRRARQKKAKFEEEVYKARIVLGKQARAAKTTRKHRRTA